MNAKEYLQQLYRLDIVIKQNQEEIAKLKEMAAVVSSPAMSPDKVLTSKNPKGANFEKCIVKINDIENTVMEEIELYAAKRRKIVNEIQSLENTAYIQVLYKRYAEFKSFWKIAKEMNYVFSYVKELHKKSLKEFEKNILKHTKTY